MINRSKKGFFYKWLLWSFVLIFFMQSSMAACPTAVLKQNLQCRSFFAPVIQDSFDEFRIKEYLSEIEDSLPPREVAKQLAKQIRMHITRSSNMDWQVSNNAGFSNQIIFALESILGKCPQPKEKYKDIVFRFKTDGNFLLVSAEMDSKISSRTYKVLLKKTFSVSNLQDSLAISSDLKQSKNRLKPLILSKNEIRKTLTGHDHKRFKKTMLNGIRSVLASDPDKQNDQEILNKKVLVFLRNIFIHEKLPIEFFLAEPGNGNSFTFKTYNTKDMLCQVFSSSFLDKLYEEKNNMFPEKIIVFLSLYTWIKSQPRFSENAKQLTLKYMDIVFEDSDDNSKIIPFLNLDLPENLLSSPPIEIAEKNAKSFLIRLQTMPDRISSNLNSFSNNIKSFKTWGKKISRTIIVLFFLLASGVLIFPPEKPVHDITPFQKYNKANIVSPVFDSTAMDKVWDNKSNIATNTRKNIQEMDQALQKIESNQKDSLLPDLTVPKENNSEIALISADSIKHKESFEQNGKTKKKTTQVTVKTENKTLFSDKEPVNKTVSEINVKTSEGLTGNVKLELNHEDSKKSYSQFQLISPSFHGFLLGGNYLSPLEFKTEKTFIEQISVASGIQYHLDMYDQNGYLNLGTSFGSIKDHFQAASSLEVGYKIKSVQLDIKGGILALHDDNDPENIVPPITPQMSATWDILKLALPDKPLSGQIGIRWTQNRVSNIDHHLWMKGYKVEAPGFDFSVNAGYKFKILGMDTKFLVGLNIWPKGPKPEDKGPVTAVNFSLAGSFIANDEEAAMDFSCEKTRQPLMGPDIHFLSEIHSNLNKRIKQQEKKFRENALDILKEYLKGISEEDLQKIAESITDSWSIPYDSIQYYTRKASFMGDSEEPRYALASAVLGSENGFVTSNSIILSEELLKKMQDPDLKLEDKPISSSDRTRISEEILFHERLEALVKLGVVNYMPNADKLADYDPSFHLISRKISEKLFHYEGDKKNRVRTLIHQIVNEHYIHESTYDSKESIQSVTIRKIEFPVELIPSAHAVPMNRILDAALKRPVLNYQTPGGIDSIKSQQNILVSS